MVLFIWRNFDDGRLMLDHRRWMPIALMQKALRGDHAYLRGWSAACARRREAISFRMKDSAHRKITDAQIFELVGVEARLNLSRE